ncbi:MAG: addiction module protein [Verrucomicrobia bacterium]|nr:addiction module protein [Verrucomicrobiota bacterium]
MDAILLETEALSLSPLERARLADKLLNSLSNPAQDQVLHAWVHLAEQRLVAHERGEMTDLDGPAYLSGLRNRISLS